MTKHIYIYDIRVLFALNPLAASNKYRSTPEHCAYTTDNSTLVLLEPHTYGHKHISDQ